MTVPVVDLAPFLEHFDPSTPSPDQLKSAQHLVDVCHAHGFATIVGHGVPQSRLDEAFEWSQKLFSLPLEDKMKAPHPDGPVPHRGYSGTGVEKVYSKTELAEQEVLGNGQAGKTLRKIKDYKESYEVGSEANKTHYNIWLPENVLPGYRAFALSFYWELDAAARRILSAFAVGLQISAETRAGWLKLFTGNNNQLRLLHYPSIESQRLKDQVAERMPAHHDWSGFTLDFEDDVGGLEFHDPASGQFVQAKPTRGACLLNIGDMLERFSNGKVGLPPAMSGPEVEVSKERYSLPYFFSVDDDSTVKPLPSKVTGGGADADVFEPIRFSEYADWIAKHSYTKNEN